MPTHDERATVDARLFKTTGAQVIGFTTFPDGLPLGAVLSKFFPAVSGLFDAEPQAFPAVAGMPPELPQVVMQNKSGSWRADVAAGRLGVAHRQETIEDEPLDLDVVIPTALKTLSDYSKALGMTYNRLALVVSRYAVLDHAAKVLARHFCNDERLKQPFNRPENFEVHSHKVFSLDRFTVNSWVRVRTAMLRSKGPLVPGVTVEQDINTVADEKSKFATGDVDRFYSLARREVDTILGLYFPVGAIVG